MSDQLTLLREERPDPHPAHAIDEAWWVGFSGGRWVPVVVHASPTNPAPDAPANPALIYGAPAHSPEPLAWFLERFPGAKWRRLPWPKENP